MPTLCLLCWQAAFANSCSTRKAERSQREREATRSRTVCTPGGPCSTDGVSLSRKVPLFLCFGDTVQVTTWKIPSSPSLSSVPGRAWALEKPVEAKTEILARPLWTRVRRGSSSDTHIKQKQKPNKKIQPTTSKGFCDHEKKNPTHKRNSINRSYW